MPIEDSSVPHSERASPLPIQPQQYPSAEKSMDTYIYIVIILCISGIVGALGYRFYRQSQPTASDVSKNQLPTEASKPAVQAYTPTPAPSPTPIQLHSGPGEYTVSHPKSTGPRIRSVKFNPLDVRKGAVFTISTVISSESTLESVTGLLTADSSVIELNFTKTATEVSSQTWSTQITMTDSVWYTYILTITAKNLQGSTKVTVAPRS